MTSIRRTPQGFRRGRMTALPMAVALVSVLLVGCQDDTVVDDAQDDPAAQEAILDETVTVQNEVSEVVGPSLITIGADDTPVTVATVDTSTLSEGDQVQVTGTVQQISMPEEYTTEVSPRWGVAYEQNEYDYLGGRQYDLGIRADSVEVLEQD